MYGLSHILSNVPEYGKDQRQHSVLSDLVPQSDIFAEYLGKISCLIAGVRCPECQQ